MAYIFDNLLYLFFLFFLLLQLKQQFFVALFHAATVCPRENRARLSTHRVENVGILPIELQKQV